MLALKNETCKTLCTADVKAESVAFLSDRITEEYVFNWFIDSLPAAQVYRDESTKETFYNAGIPLGWMEAVSRSI